MEKHHMQTTTTSISMMKYCKVDENLRYFFHKEYQISLGWIRRKLMMGGNLKHWAEWKWEKRRYFCILHTVKLYC